MEKMMMKYREEQALLKGYIVKFNSFLLFLLLLLLVMHMLWLILTGK